MFVEYFLCIRRLAVFPDEEKNPKAALKTGIGKVGGGCSRSSKGHVGVGGTALVGTGTQCG